MAMTVAGFAVGVAAIPIESASMGECGTGEYHRQNDGEQRFHW